MIKEWISVKDILPENTMKVFFMDTSMLYPDNVFSGVYYKHLDRWIRSGSLNQQNNITHWMPIPPKP